VGKLSETPFERIMDAMRDGDRDAWNRAFVEVMPEVIRAIHRRFGNSRQVDAEEAAISACRTVFRRMTQNPEAFAFASYADLAGLIVKSAWFKCQGILREKHAIQLPDLPSDEGFDAPSTQASNARPEDALLREELCQQIEEAICRIHGTLNETYAAVCDRKLSGETNAVIAAELGITIRSVTRIWHGIKNKLQTELKDYVED